MDYEPCGIRFFDSASSRNMILITEGHSTGWLCWKHPDGQWVTQRKATPDDYERVTKALGEYGTRLRMMDLIDALRQGEGNAVEILCDNPEGEPNCAVECTGDWTNWQPRRFSGATLLLALEDAAHEMGGNPGPFRLGRTNA